MTEDRQQPEDTQQRLLEAAVPAFAEKGLKATSVRAICQQAGANIAAVNYYFGSKEQLYIDAVKYAHRGCVEGVPLPEWEPDTPPRDKLRSFIRTLVIRMMQPHKPSSHQLMMRELAQPTKACEEVVHDYIQPMAAKLQGILLELLPERSLRDLILVAFSIVGQCLFYRQNRSVAALLIGEEEFEKLDIDLVAEHISSFTLRALGLEEA